MLKDNSIVATVWFTAVMAGVYKYKDVPNLSNLREIVGRKLREIGYDITEPSNLNEVG